MSSKQLIENAIKSLKAGKLIICVDDPNRENEGDIIGLLDFISAKEINFMIKYGRGLLCTPISEQVAIRHNIILAPKFSSDGTNFALSIDSPKNTTGISAFERFETMQDLTSLKPIKFRTPGHTFPLIAKKGGLSMRRGHTEAAIDLARLADASEVAAIIEIVDEDGHMMRGERLKNFAKEHSLPLISISELVEYISTQRLDIFALNESPTRFSLSRQSHIPTAIGEFNIVAIKDTMINKDYVLVFKGELYDQNNGLGRIHSACMTSESLGSLRCDCTAQLKFALKAIQDNGKGFLLYTPDEGRGIGIFDKISAYSFQDEGLDTFDANLKIGHKPDERTFEPEAHIFKLLGIKNITLISNNPEKIEILKKHDIQVKVVNYWKENKFNEKYLDTKKKKFNHFDKD